AIGSCFCGKIRVELRGQPLQSGLCHCLDCRKMTGSHCSYSYVVKLSDVIISGTPREVAKTADSGNSVRNYFCGDCGTPLFGRKIKADGEFYEIMVVRAGIFDDENLLNERKPEAELYTPRRLKWVDPVEGAAQVSGMWKL
ncbi:Mss4-like protein, partial [Delphinella strobiligena]